MYTSKPLSTSGKPGWWGYDFVSFWSIKTFELDAIATDDVIHGTPQTHCLLVWLHEKKKTKKTQKEWGKKSKRNVDLHKTAQPFSAISSKCQICLVEQLDASLVLKVHINAKNKAKIMIETSNNKQLQTSVK